MNFAITCILQKLQDFDVLGVSHENLQQEIKNFRPDLLIFELERNIEQNLILIDKIRMKYPDLKTLVLFDKEDQGLVKRLLEYDFEGYLYKDTTQEELILATMRIKGGDTYYDKKISKVLTSDLTNKPVKSQKKDDDLSPREKEILEYIVLGDKNFEIAQKLNISENTVLTHRRNIMRKMNVKSTPQLIAKSIKNGIITFPE
jgi:DNA-binding NarL/FixJ family response regulator